MSPIQLKLRPFERSDRVVVALIVLRGLVKVSVSDQGDQIVELTGRLNRDVLDSLGKGSESFAFFLFDIRHDPIVPVV